MFSLGHVLHVLSSLAQMASLESLRLCLDNAMLGDKTCSALSHLATAERLTHLDVSILQVPTEQRMMLGAW